MDGPTSASPETSLYGFGTTTAAKESYDHGGFIGMLRRLYVLTALLCHTCFAFAQANATAAEKEVAEWVTRSMVAQQKRDWNDWSTSADRRVVLFASETIRFPSFASDDYGLRYALGSLKRERGQLYSSLQHASVINFGAWMPTRPDGCGGEDDSFPQVKVVSPRSLARIFSGESLDSSVALVIHISTPVFSNDGTQAAVYAESVGSHVDNSVRQLISLTRKTDRPAEWDAFIQTTRLFPSAVSSPEERGISSTDQAVMTAALQWLVGQQGEFDLVGLTDFPPNPAECRRRQRESQSQFEVPEATLAQLSRRNNEQLEFDTSVFSVGGVRNLSVGDSRIWSRPSVLVSLPAYSEDLAILSMIHRKSQEIPETAQYFVVLRRLSGGWSVEWFDVQKGVIVS